MTVCLSTSDLAVGAVGAAHAPHLLQPLAHVVDKSKASLSANAFQPQRLAVRAARAIIEARNAYGKYRFATEKQAHKMMTATIVSCIFNLPTKGG